jgi:hypothetical protein
VGETGSVALAHHRLPVREPICLRYRRYGMLALRSALLAVCAVALVGGCVGSAPAPTASPDPSAAPTLAIRHPNGPTDVILRMSTGGGFLAPGALLTEVPEFTLYGDGTLIARVPESSVPSPALDDGIFRSAPFLTIRLSEAQIQAALADAIGPGGLGNARERYDPCCIADAPSTTFTVDADGLNKTVTVGALDFDEPSPGPDSGARTALRELAVRLRQFDGGGTDSVPYVPATYRGILSDGPGIPAGAIRDWPWAFGPDGFVPSTSGPGFGVPTRTLSAEDVAMLKVADLGGVAQSIALRTKDGKAYLLSLRPLLPDELH